MNLTDISHSIPMPLKGQPAPAYPTADDLAPTLGGFVFAAGPAPETGGVFALTLAVDGRAYPVVIGEGENLKRALAEAESDLPPLPGALGRLWMERAQKRQRPHIVRDLVAKLNPPLNGEGRTGAAPAAIAALGPDRAQQAFPPPVEAVSSEVSEQALDRLVRTFYAAAREDALIGPVVSGAIADWERHYQVVHDFWSRALLGTTRYDGFPFAVHVPLNLKPEHFDRWLAVFRAVAADTLPSDVARLAIAKVEHMSQCFQAGLMPVGPAA